MKFLVLIGTSHCHQLLGNPAENEFRDFLKRLCAAHQVRAIAEEMSLDALAENHVSQSVCDQLAKAMGIAHRYCDPNKEQRDALHVRQENDITLQAFAGDWDDERVNMEIRASHAIRERYWWEQLLNLNQWPALFVCGANHVEYFYEILQTNGVSVNVPCRDWVPACD